MGQLVDGVWQDVWYDTKSSGGKFVRSTARFRNWITPDGSAGPSGAGGFKAEPGRYHLYVSLACPWAHRTLVFRKLKGLEDLIPVSVVHPDMLEDGWTFSTGFPGTTGDGLYGLPFLRDIYTKADPKVSGRVTLPVLWDKQHETIVSNESSEIIRMFNSAFDGITGNREDYWPAALRDRIEAMNTRVYDNVNNGVYKAGFATSQSAYDEAVTALFETLDWLENHLASNRYLLGDRATEADWRLATTLWRFDPVYHLHFKCNRRRIVDYPNLWGYARELYQWTTADGSRVADTVNFDHIVRHYHPDQPGARLGCPPRSRAAARGLDRAAVIFDDRRQIVRRRLRLDHRGGIGDVVEDRPVGKERAVRDEDDLGRGTAVAGVVGYRDGAAIFQHQVQHDDLGIAVAQELDGIVLRMHDDRHMADPFQVPGPQPCQIGNSCDDQNHHSASGGGEPRRMNTPATVLNEFVNRPLTKSAIRLTFGGNRPSGA